MGKKVVEESQDFFYVRINGCYEQVRFKDIIYVRSHRGYLQIVTPQRTFLVMNMMKVLIEILPEHLFCRIHRSYIVRIERVKAFDLTWVRLHDPPSDGSYKKGLALQTKFPVGEAHRVKLYASVKLLLNRTGATRLWGVGRQKEEAQVLLEEMESELEKEQ